MYYIIRYLTNLSISIRVTNTPSQTSSTPKNIFEPNCENTMMELFIHIYENKTFQDPWAHFEHAHLKQLGNKLMGSVPSFENTHHFRSWVNSLAKSIQCISF